MGAASKALIVGYYGYRNAGDEWLLGKVCLLLKQYVSSLEWGVLSHLSSYTHYLSGPCRCFSRFSLLGIIRGVLWSDIVVFGGGSLFQNQTSRMSFFYYMFVLNLSRLCGRPVYLLGQGFGPVTGSFTRQFFKFSLKGVKQIQARDEEAYHHYLSLGVSSKQLSQSYDLVYYQQEFRPSFSSNSGIALSIRGDYVQCEGLSELLGFLPLLSSKTCFLDTQTDYNDLAACYDMSAYDSKDMLSLLDDWQDSLSLVIGMRYHACVWASLKGLPFIALAYDPKIISLAKMFNQPYIDLRVPGSVDALKIMINSALEHGLNLSKQIESAIGTLCKKEMTIDL